MESILKGISSLGISIFPGISLWMFWCWRHGIEPLIKSPLKEESFFYTGKYIFDIALFLFSGIIVYYAYRGAFHFWLWEKLWGKKGIPQQNFHKKICGNDCKDEIRDNLGISQACLFMTQIQKGKRYCEATESFNTGSHILYLTVIIFVIFALHDIVVGIDSVIINVKIWDYYWLQLILWVFLCALFIRVAFYYDRLADYREFVFLAQHEKEYSDIVKNIKINNIFNASK